MTLNFVLQKSLGFVEALWVGVQDWLPMQFCTFANLISIKNHFQSSTDGAFLDFVCRCLLFGGD